MNAFLPNPPFVCLAPMAGFTDASFRLLAKEQGAQILYTEMISAKGLLFESSRTEALLKTDPAEGPVFVQLFGREPELMARAARRIADSMGASCLGIDINMGCPAPKIAGNGEGSALMKEPGLAGRIVSAVAGAVPLPVTVKFRKGWDHENENAVSFARAMEDSGASMLTIHGRTREQLYAGKADLECIYHVKQAVSIPVIGNGDVTDGASAMNMLEKTGCDGVMVGRGALGNPFIFSEIRAAFENRPSSPVSLEQRFSMALRHAEMAYLEKGSRGLVEMRKHLPFYVTGFPGASRLRVALQTAETLDDIRAILT